MLDLSAYDEMLSTNKIPSENLGFILEGEKLCFCFLDKSQKDNGFAFCLENGKSVSFEDVIPVNSLFYVVEQLDELPYGDEKAALYTNENSLVFQKIKTKKSKNLLLKLSQYEKELFWYSEDEGVEKVNIDKEKEIKLKDVIKTQDKINKYEAERIKKEEKESKFNK